MAKGMAGSQEWIALWWCGSVLRAHRSQSHLRKKKKRTGQEQSQPKESKESKESKKSKESKESEESANVSKRDATVDVLSTVSENDDGAGVDRRQSTTRRLDATA